MHPISRLLPAVFLAVLAPAAAPAAGPAVVDLTADPPRVNLVGPTATWSLLVSGTAAGRPIDLTRSAAYRSSDPKVVIVNDRGVLRPAGDGTAEVVVEYAGKSARVAVEVRESRRPRTFHFETDVEPLFGRFSCNTSGCHGKAEGQNGFKLSVFGFDPRADHDAILKEDRGRRVLPAAPEQSLLVTKAAGRVPHGGGTRMPVGSDAYETLRGWVAAGTPFGDPDVAHVRTIRVDPAERVLDFNARQQLRVIATWTDGRETDATAQARFQTNNEALALVDADGLVSAGDVPGEVAVMASYMGAVAVFRAVLPRPGPDAGNGLPRRNFIDEAVDARLRKLNLRPSGVCGDADYVRRVYLDVIGTLPTADEARRFLAAPSADKRARLVEELMKRPEFADFWAMKWADLLRVDRDALGHKAAYAYYRWIRQSFAENKPLDQFAREVIEAEGPLAETPAAAFYKAVKKPGEQAGSLSQVFLGVRITCAECHHHPFDRWGQHDYYGMQAFFNPLALKATPAGEALQAAGPAVATHPRTKETLAAFALGEARPEPPKAGEAADGDARRRLADWMTAKDNPFFARNLANRAWAHFAGRGLIEPVDDVRATNPPTNPELLDALARHLVESGYDFRALIRVITASRTYQASSTPNETNERDEQNYSRALFKRLDAEVLLDAVSQTTGVREKFDGMPAGVRAVQAWDSKVPHYFLKVFGRPVRATACACERVTEPSVAQVLHVLNSPEIQSRLDHAGGTVARLIRTQAEDGKLVEELYLTAYARFPTEKERAVAVEHLRRDPTRRREAAEDLLWVLLNTVEFGFNH